MNKQMTMRIPPNKIIQTYKRRVLLSDEPVSTETVHTPPYRTTPEQVSSMFASFAFTSAVLAALTSVSAANPIFVRDTCKPNFEGNRETIYHTNHAYRLVNEWSSANSFGSHVTLKVEHLSIAFQTAEFLVPFSGGLGSTYQFK
jgi:hypothetical protein